MTDEIKVHAVDYGLLASPMRRLRTATKWSPVQKRDTRGKPVWKFNRSLMSRSRMANQ
jgi:hypothetical protein